MLLTQPLDKLETLGVFGMVLGLREQLESNQYLNLSFDERLGLLVDREAETRDSRRLALRLKAAKLRQEATVEDLDFRAPRGLDRSVVLSLAQAGWVAAHHNLLITGPTGAGKSFVACALTHAAIRRGHTALYVRTPRLLAELALSRGDGRYVRRLGQLARIGLLVLDDFLLTPPSVIEAKDLLEVIDDRSQVRSTLVVSQLPVEAWPPALAGGDPTLADAILDRLVQHAHRLPLTGASMRRRQPPPETGNPGCVTIARLRMHNARAPCAGTTSQREAAKPIARTPAASVAFVCVDDRPTSSSSTWTGVCRRPPSSTSAPPTMGDCLVDSAARSAASFISCGGEPGVYRDCP
jgi:DNA replication protein DnaC